MVLVICLFITFFIYLGTDSLKAETPNIGSDYSGIRDSMHIKVFLRSKYLLSNCLNCTT